MTYVPVANRMTDRTRMVQFMQQYDFATLISNGPDGIPTISYTPVMTHMHGDDITIEFHLANVNPHNQLLQAGVPAVAIFHGPHAFISPQWYESQHAVPTWNYAVVHASGVAMRLDGVAATMQMVNNLTELYGEPAYDEASISHMLKGITAYRMPVTTLWGKFKLGQNRPLADRIGMRTQLAHAERPLSRELAQLMAEFEPPAEQV